MRQKSDLMFKLPVISPISPPAWKIDGWSKTKSAVPLAPVLLLLSRTSGIVGSSMPFTNSRRAALHRKRARLARSEGCVAASDRGWTDRVLCIPMIVYEDE